MLCCTTFPRVSIDWEEKGGLMREVPGSNVNSVEEGFVLHLNTCSGSCKAQVDVIEVRNWLRHRRR